MNRDTLKQIMVDQKDIYLNNPIIVRHYPLEENINYCFVIMNIYPYSFSEYLIANGKEKNYQDIISTSDKAEVLSLYDEYVTYGAFPELVKVSDHYKQ